jgi:hypothetical protein
MVVVGDCFECQRKPNDKNTNFETIVRIIHTNSIATPYETLLLSLLSQKQF